jgi:hypothetical protein
MQDRNRFGQRKRKQEPSSILSLHLEEPTEVVLHRFWNRCSQVWLEDGRMEDFPHGFRSPEYAPSFGKRLGMEFVARFFRELPFFIGKLRDNDQPFG